MVMPDDSLIHPFAGSDLAGARLFSHEFRLWIMADFSVHTLIENPPDILSHLEILHASSIKSLSKDYCFSPHLRTNPYFIKAPQKSSPHAIVRIYIYNLLIMRLNII